MHARRFSILIFLLVILTTSPACTKATPLQQAQNVSQSPTIIVSFTTAPSPSYTSTNKPTLTATFTLLPPTLTSTSTKTSIPTEVCSNHAEFIKHLTVGDGTAMKPGEYFAKLWRIKNIGTCIWTEDYSFVYTGGNNMDGDQSIQLPDIVKPGDIVDLRVDLIAPNEAAKHTGNWMLQDSTGNQFGVGETGDKALAVIIEVKPTPKATSS